MIAVQNNYITNGEIVQFWLAWRSTILLKYSVKKSIIQKVESNSESVSCHRVFGGRITLLEFIQFQLFEIYSVASTETKDTLI
jgi:hypothetical protein